MQRRTKRLFTKAMKRHILVIEIAVKEVTAVEGKRQVSRLSPLLPLKGGVKQP